MVMVGPFTLNFTEPMVFLLHLYIALIYGLLYIWFESFPIVFVGIYGFSLGKEGLAFIGILIRIFIVIPSFFWYMHKYLEPQFNENGELQPEKHFHQQLLEASSYQSAYFGSDGAPDLTFTGSCLSSALFGFPSEHTCSSILF